MYKVIKKPLTPNMVWDAEHGKPLCRFKNGVLETDDKTVADKLAAMGYSVENDTVEAETAEQTKAVTTSSAPKTTRRNRK